MPLFSVIIPTYNHEDTIIWSIKSVQEQTFQDFEIIVVGDGVPDRTREIMAEFCAEDDRILFRDNPKGEGRGERLRHPAILEASGKYIAYNGDDDIWHKSHLSHLKVGLEQADFCNTLHGCAFPDGRLELFPGSLESIYCRQIIARMQHNFFGPTCAGHTKEAYLRLPHGWRPAPKGMWMDLYMWRQWLELPDVRFKTVPRLSTIHLDSPGRDDMTMKERAQEGRMWLEKIGQDEYFYDLEDTALRNVVTSYGGYRAAALFLEKRANSLAKELVAARAEIEKLKQQQRQVFIHE